MSDKLAARFEKASKDYEAAVQKARAAMAATKSPVFDNLLLAMGHFNHSLGEAIIALSLQIDEVDRNVRNIAARLDGKEGPFNLKMR